MTTYRGNANGPSGPHLILCYDDDDTLIGPLPHKVKRHSPTGFSWGYAGSGPADLALNLLIDALGPSASCRICHGSGRDGFRDQCYDCYGTGVNKRIEQNYQKFKAATVATWPQDGAIEITSAEIVAWLDANAA